MTDDILKGKILRLPVLDKGFIELIDCMPRLVKNGQTADIAIANAARRSYGEGTKRISSDEDLIRYLMRRGEGGPVEFVEFVFHVKCPMFLGEQILRTRIAEYNKLSGRYSELVDDFYLPDRLRSQSTANKQGSGEELDRADLPESMKKATEANYALYQDLLKENVAKEQARMILPASTYTDLFWKLNLRSLQNFLDQRCDESGMGHPQNETRAYGEAILKIIEPIIPVTLAAWNDYSPRRGAITLTRLEVEAIQHRLRQMDAPCIPAIASNNKREIAEWGDKAKKLGFS